MNYYNEHDPYAAAWLRELIKARLIPDGLVDERDIQLVQPGDVHDFTQCHFFSGIGGWSYALQLAGWPEDQPVWTGSCPCQPFSSAGKQLGIADKRHLWPEFKRLIKACHPPICFGEQVAKKAGLLWLDGVRTDLESLGYEVGAADLAAAGVGAPHIRQRIYWMANSKCPQGGAAIGPRGRNGAETAGTHDESGRCGNAGDMGESTINGNRKTQNGRSLDESEAERRFCFGGGSGSFGELGHTNNTGPQGRNGKELPECAGEQVAGTGSAFDQLGVANGAGSQQGKQAATSTRHRDPTQPAGCWDDFDIAHCRDGKSRRIESGTFPLAHGVPARVVRLRGYGNALCVPLAAEFIQASIEAITDL